ncbi:semialdehyde dehydrogenase [Occultella glacieicola]|uniref:Semialdehyde dehydrogenase n=1 Tax=Occultella glacieicola TaxID=2518684 RepID=A0ABY2E5H5_9MICO|nr:semialdehyde dehydrogenase [Occultella glacieicola]TDE91468.1 semialdehyde dehydrogenase [Occultella glacieicola]
MSDASFAFLVHPRAHLAPDLGLVWAPLARVPERYYDLALRKLPLRPFTMAAVHIDGRRVGRIVMVPYGARHLLEDPVEGRARVHRAVDVAARAGADVVGLGALTATVTRGGLSLTGRTDIGVTNGNAFTAATVDSQARRLLDGLDGLNGLNGTAGVLATAGRRVAVVGASGSVGAAVSELLAADGGLDHLSLIARSRPRLEALAERIAGRVPTTIGTDLNGLAEADLVILLTASADALVRPDHLAPDAVVLDATQPRNTAPDLLEARPDVRVVDGGIVSIPSLRLTGGDLGLSHGRAYACFAETALLALTGHTGHFCLGVPTLEQVAHVRALAADLAHLGFTPAEPTSFGRPLATAATVPA